MCNCKGKKEETLQPKYPPIPVPDAAVVKHMEEELNKFNTEEINPQEDINPNVDYPLIED